MRVLGIIPARRDSKRLPRKNVQLLQGKPLVLWSIEAALAAKSLSRVVVSSDDDEVLAIAMKRRGDLALRRPAPLATDESPAIDYVRHALAELEGGGESRFDAVAIVQPSSPLTRPEDIDGTVALCDSTGAESAASIMELDHALNPLKLKRMGSDHRLLPYLEEERGRMAAHEIPRLYVRNGSVYVARRAAIDAGGIVTGDCRGYLMPRERSIDINERIDLRWAEFLLQFERGAGQR
jgi:CMP-N,N'-diacetyllegionaminic acid synthase